MFYLRKDSIINNFKKYQPNIYRSCNKALIKAKYKNNVYYLNKQAFNQATAKSFDYAVLEKSKEISIMQQSVRTNLLYITLSSCLREVAQSSIPAGVVVLLG